MMGIRGFKTKKELKAAVGQRRPSFIETSMFGNEYKGDDGTYSVVGPNPYTKRDWYASVTVRNGIIVKVT